MRPGDAFDLQMGKTPSRDNSSYWNNGDHEWVSIKDLGTYGKYVGSTKETISELGRAESGIKPVPANTLIMSFKLSLGKTAITTRETYTNEAIMAFLEKGNHEINLDYMWHQFRSKDWTVGTNTAVMGKTLNKKTLGDSTIRIPSLAEQIEIADILDKVLGQIDATNNQVSHLQSLVKSRFVEMFGDGRRFQKCKIGDLVCGIVSGTNVSGKQRPLEPGELGVLKISSVTKGLFDSSEFKVVSDPNSVRKMIHPRKGDLLFSRANTSEMIGATAIVDNDYDQLFLPDKLWRLDPSRNVDTIFLKQLLSSKQIRATLSKISTGTSGSMQNISMSKFRSIDAYLPPLPLQREFAAFAERAAKLEFVALVQYNNQYRFQFNEGRSHDNRRDKEQGR